jgi:hypothetical protein
VPRVGRLRPGFLLPQDPNDLFFREPARVRVHAPARRWALPIFGGDSGAQVIIRERPDSGPSTINEKTIADFTRVVKQTGILKREAEASRRPGSCPIAIVLGIYFLANVQSLYARVRLDRSSIGQYPRRERCAIRSSKSSGRTWSPRLPQQCSSEPPYPRQFDQSKEYRVDEYQLRGQRRSYVDVRMPWHADVS